MLYKTYELISQLPAQAVLGRIKDLLSKECVKYRADDFSVTSTQTPIIILNFDPRAYSDTNWVGVNPFKYVSAINVRCEPSDSGLTKVIVRVNRSRAFFWLAFWIACGCLAASAMPQPGGTILVIGIATAAWFGLISFLAGYLVKKEISDHLKPKEPLTR